MSFGLQQLKTNLIEILSVEGNPDFLSASPFSETLYDARKGAGMFSKYFWVLTDNFLDTSNEDTKVNHVIRKTAHVFEEYFRKGKESYRLITKAWEKNFKESEELEKEKHFFCEFYQTFYPLHKLLQNPKTWENFQKIFKVFSENFHFDIELYEDFSKIFHLIQFENFVSAKIPWSDLANIRFIWVNAPSDIAKSISSWTEKMLNPPFLDFYTEEGVENYLEEASKRFRKCIYFIFELLEKQKLNTAAFFQMLGAIYLLGGEKLFTIPDKNHVKWLESLDEKSEFISMGNVYHMEGKLSLDKDSCTVPVREDPKKAFFFSKNRLYPLAVYGIFRVQSSIIPFVEVNPPNPNENQYFLTERLYERMGNIDWMVEENKIRMLDVVRLVSALDRNAYMPAMSDGSLPPSGFGFTYSGHLKVDILLLKQPKNFFLLESFARALTESSHFAYSHIYKQCFLDNVWTAFFNKIFVAAIDNKEMPSYASIGKYPITSEDMDTRGKPFYENVKTFYSEIKKILRNYYETKYSPQDLRKTILDMREGEFCEFPGPIIVPSEAFYFGMVIAFYLKLKKRDVPLKRVDPKIEENAILKYKLRS